MSDLNPELGRVASLNRGNGAVIEARNQCGVFPFKLMKMTDPRVDPDTIGDYDKNVIAYLGARNWNKQKFPKEYTNPSQLKFSNIKTSGSTYLISMKWWIEYHVTVTFDDFLYPHTSATNANPAEGHFGGINNFMALRPFPLHQCTDNIHLKLNNRDIISYPMQTLNPRLEYINQEKLRDACNFCPHRKPNVQTTYEYAGGKNGGRSPWINPGTTYDGDCGNESGPYNIKWSITTTNTELKDWGYTKDLEHDDNIDKTTSKGPCKIKGTLSFWMREPVLAEPLDFFSQKGATRTMYNLTEIDLEYNFNNLRNMFIFNRGAIADKTPAFINKVAFSIYDRTYDVNKKDWYNDVIEHNLSSGMSVSITDANLLLDVATPQLPTDLPFVTDYVEYKRFETLALSPIKVANVLNDRDKIYQIDSDIYSLAYMPNSIYIWVAPNDATVTGTDYRCVYNNTYAQITGLEIDYGNLSNLGNHYDEQDLYLMAVRNGLEDRTFADWTRTTRNFYEYNAGDMEVATDSAGVKKICDREFFGVGSVLRVIPGVDICSGGEVTLIGGMKITNETMRFHVKYRPLNMFDDNITYSLFVAFEYNGICTFTPHFCDTAMIHIDSFNQIADAERAPRYKLSKIYGKGVWDKIKSGLSKVNNFAKKTGVVSKVMSMVPHPAAQMGAMAANAMGYGYGAGRRSTRMRGGRVIPPGSFYRTY